MEADGEIKLGEWLPDLPFRNNPGLVEAKNCIPVDGSYKDQLALLTSDDALANRPQGAFAAIDTTGTPEIYAGDATKLYQKQGTAWTDRSGAVYATAEIDYWRFAQFGDLAIATNFTDAPQKREIGSPDLFDDLAVTGTAPKARQIGVINDFVILGDTTDATNGAVPARVQWCAIGDATDWPIMGTADARSKQSSEQFLDAGFGAVTAIANGQFYGQVFQERAVTRFTYQGGDTVFQVQRIEESSGCWAPQSMIQIGSRAYFLASDGFYVSDGQTVAGIGNGKIDKTFYFEFDQTYRERVTTAVDLINKAIFWAYPSSSAVSGVPDKLICYNFVENRWAHGDETLQLLFHSFSQAYTLEQLDSLFTSIDDMTVSLDSSLWSGGIPTIMGFGSNKLGTLSGAAKVARFETGETDLNPFGYNFVSGVKPLVTGNPTAITVALAARASQDNEARTFGAAMTRTARTGVCDFRTQGRYISARMEITGGFDRALALQYDAEEGDGV